MKKVYDNCCGIDVHKKLIVACSVHGREQEVRELGNAFPERPGKATLSYAQPLSYAPTQQ